MPFDDLTIPGDYSDYHIFGEEKETISLNDTVLIKNQKEIRRVRVMQINYSNKIEDIKHLEIKWIDDKKKEGFL